MKAIIYMYKSWFVC